MYTLRLILKGVIFLAMVKTPNGHDRLWLLFLDPGYTTGMPHHSRLYVDSQFKDASSRSSDGTDGQWSYFDLSGDHLTLSFSQLPKPSSLFFVKNTRVEGQIKPCFDCGSTFSFRQQKDDFQWVSSLSEILRNVPRKLEYTFEEAVELREDIFAGSYKTDKLILARVAVDRGEVRTYTLWYEKDDAFNLDPNKISIYAFPRPPQLCSSADSQVAVAQTVAIEFAVPDKVTLISRSLADETKPGRGNIVIKGRAGTLVEVRLMSMRHNGSTDENDFNIFYDLLKNKDYFQFLPVPQVCVGPDSGGACSPVRP